MCNIWKQQCKVTVRANEKLCPSCKGQGAEFVNASFKQRHFTVKYCPLCKGEGKVDWIAAVTKRPEHEIDPKPWHGIASRKVKKIKIKCIGAQKCKKRLKRLWNNRKDKAFGYPWWYEY